MKKVWLKSQNKWSNTPFIKVYPKEYIKIGDKTEIVRCDKNYQVIRIDNHPELNYFSGRPYLLVANQIMEELSNVKL